MICKKCNGTDFIINGKQKSGKVKYTCKFCKLQRRKIWAKNTGYDKAWYADHRIYYLNKAAKHNKKEKAKEARRERHRKNPIICNKQTNKYFANKRRAMPLWLDSDNKWLIDEIYYISSMRTMLTGIKHHVDHIVPLNGKNVSGLHVPWNLQVLNCYDNCKKGNKEDSIWQVM